MKTNYKITIEVDANYPLDKLSTKMKEQLNKNIIDWVRQEGIMPSVYEPTKGYSIEHQPSGKISVKIVRDKEIILDTWWDELSDDF